MSCMITFYKIDLDRPKKLLILINPVGGNQDAIAVHNDLSGPLFTLAGIHLEVLGKFYFNKDERREILTRSFDKSPYNNLYKNKATTQIANKKFDYTTIFDRLTTVSWSNYFS